LNAYIKLYLFMVKNYYLIIYIICLQLNL